MLNRKIKVKWIILVTVLSSLLISLGFVYYNWKALNNFELVTLPVKGFNEEPPTFLLNIEGENEKETLQSPLAVAVDKNSVFVTDSKNNRINVYTKKGKFRYSFGEYGVKNGQFVYPNTIAIDSKGRIYVGEFQTRRVQVFDPEGKHLKTIVGDKIREVVPLSITIQNDNLYVVNRTGEILILGLDGSLKRKIGKPGTAEGQLNFPNGVAVAKDGRIFVSDSGNSRVQVFSNRGQFIKVLESREYRLNLPRGLTIDEFGRLYVVDTFSHSISVYDENLDYLFSFGTRGTNKGELNFPNDVFIDDDFRIYAADRENNRVVVYNY